MANYIYSAVPSSGNESMLVSPSMFLITQTFTVADLTATATSQTISFNFGVMPEGAEVLMVVTDLVTEFTGGGAGLSNLDLVNAADDTPFGVFRNLFNTPGREVAGVITTSVVGMTIGAKIASDVNVDTLTAGEVSVGLLVAVVPV